MHLPPLQISCWILYSKKQTFFILICGKLSEQSSRVAVQNLLEFCRDPLVVCVYSRSGMGLHNSVIGLLTLGFPILASSMSGQAASPSVIHSNGGGREE